MCTGLVGGRTGPQACSLSAPPAPLMAGLWCFSPSWVVFGFWFLWRSRNFLMACFPSGLGRHWWWLCRRLQEGRCTPQSLHLTSPHSPPVPDPQAWAELWMDPWGSQLSFFWSEELWVTVHVLARSWAGRNPSLSTRYSCIWDCICVIILLQSLISLGICGSSCISKLLCIQ